MKLAMNIPADSHRTFLDFRSVGVYAYSAMLLLNIPRAERLIPPATLLGPGNALSISRSSTGLAMVNKSHPVTKPRHVVLR